MNIDNWELSELKEAVAEFQTTYQGNFRDETGSYSDEGVDEVETVIVEELKIEE